jgi:hypothetical protein
VDGLSNGTAYYCVGTAVNAAGQSAPSTVASVTPAAPPTGTIITPASGASYVLNAVVKSSFDCSDGIGGLGIASCVDQDGNSSGSAIDTSSPGSQTFTVTATSKGGQRATKSVDCSVTYMGDGFKPPVNNPPTVNTGKAGRTYPVKWQLQDATGRYISALSAVKSIKFESVPPGRSTAIRPTRLRPPQPAGPACATTRALISTSTTGRRRPRQAAMSCL